MTSSYITHAWRAIRHNWQYMLISMLGLVLSLAGAIIIARYVHQELTVDHYIPELDRTMVLYNARDNGSKLNNDFIHAYGFDNYPFPYKDKDVEAYTQFFAFDEAYVTSSNRETTMSAIIADSCFFDLLPRKIAKGALPSSVFQAVIAEDIADMLWPGENPLGKTISMYSDRNSYTVVGVTQRPSTKSNFDFDALFCNDTQSYKPDRLGWAICRLIPGASHDSINAHTPRCERNDGYTEVLNAKMMPLADLYFDQTFNHIQKNKLHLEGNIYNIRMLQIVGALLIMVGLFNFLNIYSIVMAARRRGFGVRKAFGAKAVAIFAHIFTENFILASIAVIFAWAIIVSVSPLLDRYYNIDQHPSMHFDIVLSAAIAIALPLIVSAGATYGIWRNAHVHSMDNTEPHKAIALRRYCLLLPQMALSLILITISVYFMRQMHYMLNADMGFETENILSFTLRPYYGKTVSRDIRPEEIEILNKKVEKEREIATATIAKIRALPQVLAASATYYTDEKPTLFSTSNTGLKIRKAGNTDGEWIDARYLFLSPDMMDVFDIKVDEGITLSEYEDAGGNAKYDYKAITTPHLLKELGISDMHSEHIQIEHRLWWEMGVDCSGNPPYEAIGIVNNLRFSPLSYVDKPTIIIATSNGEYGNPIIRYRHEDKEKLLAELTKIYQEINGEDAVPEFEFSEDVTAEVYAKDKRAARIYATFALIAVFISCLGLYGVVAYDMQRRQREFTIRRVQGASRSDILRLVFKPYSATIAIAAAIAAPIAIYAIVRYQSHYSDHAAMLPWGFIGGVAAIALVAYTTIMLQVKAIFKKKSLIS